MKRPRGYMDLNYRNVEMHSGKLLIREPTTPCLLMLKYLVNIKKKYSNRRKILWNTSKVIT